MTTYYQDDSITLHHGDALETARTLEPASIDCIVTSPPYFRLRDYGNEGQYGLEDTPAAYVETMRALFSDLRRVLADDGTLWLNIGDSYGKGKQLGGIPWRVAIALQDDGWILRNAVVWHKPNAMPTSIRDRLASKHEQLFIFAKSPKYHFDLDAIRQSHTSAGDSRNRPDFEPKRTRNVGGREDGFTTATGGLTYHPLGKNPGDVWTIPPKPFKGAHSAVMPPELARRAILAGCKAGGIVLDPFSGSGTTGMVARANGRKYVGIDISADYLKLSLETRLQNAALDLEGVA